MNKYHFLTEQKWSENLGRKAPPLRSCLCFAAYYQWLREKYNFRASNLFITFSRFESGNTNSDTIVNAKEKARLVKIITRSIKGDPNKINKDLNYLKKVSLDLVKTSKQLAFKKFTLKQRFDIFCLSWEKFSPAYYNPIFLQAALEKIILAKYKNRPEIYAAVLNFISSGFKSEAFKLKVKRHNQKYKFSKKELTYLKLLKKLARVRDIRQHCRDIAWVKSQTFLAELGRQTLLGKDVIRTAPKQIFDALERPKAHKQFPRDSLIYNLNGVRIDYSSDFSKIKKLIWPPKSSTRLIKGQPAYAGVAVGKIRRIMYYDKKFIVPGEILLTKMTTPAFVPLLKNCAGIITDAGGLTCHAAILAREFKKPCIIGTNHATSTLKTGDMVELNANTGIVKKI